MENIKLQAEILKSLDFLRTKYSYVIAKNESHWLGGVVVEYSKDDIVLSILYDKREECFVTKLFSRLFVDKTHMCLVEELRGICPSIKKQSISIDNDEEIIVFLRTFGRCLDQNFLTVIDSYTNGNYFGAIL
ncbi:MAG TPA: hypothetical protein DIW54_01205 [Chitinophagaceae bacterium]|nr:hypothetical protein [Chitinophagaceae bacterium]